MEDTKTYDELLSELLQMRMQLEEANDTIDAIRSGQVDALVVKAEDEHHLYTLKNVDQTYRIFIEQMNEGAVTLNESNTVLYANSQFALLVNLPTEKVTGKSFFSFISPICTEECAELIHNAWKANSKGELILQAANDKDIPVLISFKTLHLDEGLSMSVIITDLTAQKEAQRLLKEKNVLLEEAQSIAQQLNANLEHKVSERTKELELSVQEKTLLSEELRSNQERLSLILETMAEGVGIIDATGNLTYANPMAQKILGLQKSEILTRTYDDPKWQNQRIDGSLLPDEEHPMAIMMRMGKPVYDYEIAVQPTEGERFYISINAAPIRDTKGVLVGGVGTFMDVTNRRKSIQQKDEFISVASHELKTPMTTLKASVQILEALVSKERSSPMIPVFLNKANLSLSKLSSLIDNLLNVSRMEKGQMVLNTSSFNVYDVIKENVENLQLENRDRSVTLSGTSDITITADKYRIEQVFANLVNNAIKYSPAKTPVVVAVELCRESRSVKISVQDFGIGIPEDKLAQLFDRYFRVDYSGNNYSGLGLGLYISSEIIRRHKGTIGVDSMLGQGSTFWFMLPLEPA